MKANIRTAITLFLAVLLFVGCNKPKENDFSKLSDQEKIQLLDIKIKDNPKDAELYYQRAEVFANMGDSKDALFNIKTAIDLNSKQVKYYILEADILFARNEVTLAFQALQNALKIDKNSEEALLKTAELSLYIRDYKRCIQTVNQVLTINKNEPKAYFLRGLCMKETGDTNSAVIDYKKAIELKSDYEAPFEELGVLYANKGDALAIDYLKSTIKINPKNVNAMYTLALFYQDNGLEQQALDLYKQILDIKPDYADAIHNVGWINYEYKEDYSTALDCFTKAIKADSLFVQAWVNRAKTYEKLGNFQQAQSDYAKAQSLKKQQVK